MNPLKDFIDIYSKLVIGVISFVAPMTSYLLSTYITDRKKIISKLNEQEKNLDTILDRDFAEAQSTQQKARDFIQQSQTKLKTEETIIKEKLKLLNSLEPKRCIIFLFAYLSGAMVLLLFDVLVRADVCGLYNHPLSVILLSGSVILFVIAIRLLVSIALKLADARELLEPERIEIEKENDLINVEQEK